MVSMGAVLASRKFGSNLCGIRHRDIDYGGNRMNKVIQFNPILTDEVKKQFAQQHFRVIPNWAKKLPQALIKLLFSEIGAAGAWSFTDTGRTSLLDGTFDLDTDTFKMALFLSTSNLGAASTTYAGVTNEHANANGYTTGGGAITISLSGTTTVTVDGTDVSWTASGGSIVARFACIYEVAGNVLCYCLLDSTPADVTVTDGNILTVQIHASGIFTLA